MTERGDRQERRHNIMAGMLTVTLVGGLAVQDYMGGRDPADCRVVDADSWISYKGAADAPIGYLAGELGASPDEVRKSAAAGPIECEPGTRPEQVNWERFRHIDGLDGECIVTISAETERGTDDTVRRRYEAACLKD